MQMAMVGLGRMGGNMAERLRKGGHEIIGYDRDPTISQAGSLEELVGKLASPRTVWVMVPSGEPTEQTVKTLGELLSAGDLIVDGGNSNFRDSKRRAEELGSVGIAFVDAGTSGGIWGLAEGYCLMVGATPDAFSRIEPILSTLAPENGYAHVGPPGSGHFVKMIHNGIEYGLMQAYAEGFDILKNANIEALPPEHRFDLDIADIAEVWRRGSVVSSWLLDLTAMALTENPTLSEYSGFVQDSGEGRWTIQAAIEQAVPAEVLTAALYTRFRSRQEHTFAEKILSAMRQKFGGHVEPKSQSKTAK